MILYQGRRIINFSDLDGRRTFGLKSFTEEYALVRATEKFLFWGVLHSLKWVMGSEIWWKNKQGVFVKLQHESFIDHFFLTLRSHSYAECSRTKYDDRFIFRVRSAHTWRPHPALWHSAHHNSWKKHGKLSILSIKTHGSSIKIDILVSRPPTTNQSLGRTLHFFCFFLLWWIY